MSTRTRSLIALLVVLTAVALPVSAQDWKGRGRLQGLVTDSDGQPLEGARVTVKKEGSGDGPAPVTTDKKGRWSIGGLATGNWEVVVEKDGHVAAGGATKVIEFGPSETLRISLRPQPTQSPQQSVPASPSAAAIEQGNTFLKAGKYAEARAEYQKALAEIQENEKKAPVLFGVAQTYAAEGKKGDAIKTLEESLTYKPGDEKTLRLLVSVLVAEGREADAQKYLAQLPQGTTVDPDTLLNMGIEKFNAQDLKAALEYFDRVVKENPSLPDAYYYRGLVYLQQSKTAEAKADFQKLLELAPNHEKAAEVKSFIAEL